MIRPGKPKAVFKQAECYLKLKQFDGPNTFMNRKLYDWSSPERKERIAKVYLDFAEEYFSGNGVKRQQAMLEEQPDYSRAKTFYELALQLELSKAAHEEIRFQIARCANELGNYSEAVQVLTALQTGILRKISDRERVLSGAILSQTGTIAASS
jgi:tetratricopeptide (TPR) repeat protein